MGDVVSRYVDLVEALAEPTRDVQNELVLSEYHRTGGCDSGDEVDLQWIVGKVGNSPIERKCPFGDCHLSDVVRETLEGFDSHGFLWRLTIWSSAASEASPLQRRVRRRATGESPDRWAAMTESSGFLLAPTNEARWMCGLPRGGSKLGVAAHSVLAMTNEGGPDQPSSRTPRIPCTRTNHEVLCETEEQRTTRLGNERRAVGACCYSAPQVLVGERRGGDRKPC